MAIFDSTAPDGRRWEVFRRRLAWHPRLPRWLHDWWPAGWEDLGFLSALVAVVSVTVALPWLIWYFFSWAGSLLATPFTWFGPIRIVARLRDHRHAEWVGRFAGEADGIAQVRREIMLHGAPQSLTPPRPKILAKIDS